MSDPVVDALSAMLRESEAREQQLARRLSAAEDMKFIRAAEAVQPPSEPTFVVSERVLSAVFVALFIVGLGVALFLLTRLGAGV